MDMKKNNPRQKGKGCSGQFETHSRPTKAHDMLPGFTTIVESVKVNFLSYRYRVDKSTIFDMRGL